MEAEELDFLLEESLMGVNKKFKKNHQGQSTIEFLVSFTLVLYFIFFFLKLSFIYTTGFLVHYAVFQSSRTYYSYDSKSNEVTTVYSDAEEKATDIFGRFSLDLFISSFNANALTFNAPQTVEAPYQGVLFEYQDNLRFSSAFGESEVLDLTSESLLGKEPSAARCLERIRNVIEAQENDSGINYGGGSEMNHVTLADNGC